jgi:hypothetical protein
MGSIYSFKGTTAPHSCSGSIVSNHTSRQTSNSGNKFTYFHSFCTATVISYFNVQFSLYDAFNILRGTRSTLDYFAHHYPSFLLYYLFLSFHIVYTTAVGFGPGRILRDFVRSLDDAHLGLPSTSRLLIADGLDKEASLHMQKNSLMYVGRYHLPDSATGRQ